MSDKIRLGSIDSINLFFNALEAWKGLYQEGPYYDYPKTDETQTKQFSGMVALLRDANDPNYGEEVKVVKLNFVSFDETNPEHNRCDTQMNQADMEWDCECRVERFWDETSGKLVYRSNSHWNANATIQWNEFRDDMDEFDLGLWTSPHDDWSSVEEYETQLNRFIQDNC